MKLEELIAILEDVEDAEVVITSADGTESTNFTIQVIRDLIKYTAKVVIGTDLPGKIVIDWNPPKTPMTPIPDTPWPQPTIQWPTASFT